MMTLKGMAALGHDRAGKLYTAWLGRQGGTEPVADVGYIVVPERLTVVEWQARYSPKDAPPAADDAG